MGRKAVFNDFGDFLGYVYDNKGEYFYAPTKGVSDIMLSSYVESNFIRV